MPSSHADPFPQRVEELFHQALETEPGERAAWLAAACQGDEPLRQAAQDLLDAAEAVEKSPAWGATALTNEAVAAAGDCCTDLDRYHLSGRIGAGGMGVVYKAVRAGDYSKIVAVKVVQEDDPAIVERFLRERQILARLEHPYIARLLDGGSTPEGLPFLVMEYVEGEPIDRYVAREKPPLHDLLELFRRICSAVFYAHANLVVHRDLKPANILVTSEGEPKLLDFGVAKCLDGSSIRTKTGAGAMTPEYASPEQVEGAPITTASDIYSLGVILYELLTGARIYRTTASAIDLAREICAAEPQTLSARSGRRFDPDLERIVQMALRKEPARRYASVEQFSDDIRRYREGYPIVARPATRRYRVAKFAGRHKAGMMAAALLLLTLVDGIVATSREARLAQRRFQEARKLAHSVLFDYPDAIAALPGSTAARALLTSDALRYLDVIGKEAGGDTALQLELASAYLRVGDVQGRPYAPNLGQTEGALASYRKGLAVLEAISAKDPGNREARRQRATGLERIGNIQLRKGEMENASASQRQALRIREELLAPNPSDGGARQDVAASYLYLGDVLQGQCFDPPRVECLQKALDYQQKSLDMRVQLSGENPTDPARRREVAQAYMRVGFRLRDMSTMVRDSLLMRRSLENHQKGLDIEEDLAAGSSSNGRDRRDAADQRMVMSPVRAALGDYAGALDGYRRAIDTFQALSAADPANAESRRDLSFAHEKLALMSLKLGDNADAEKNFDAALAEAQRLLGDDPGSHEDRQTVFGSYLGKSLVAEQTGEFAKAAENYAKVAEATPSGQAYYHVVSLYVSAAQDKRATVEQRAGYWRAARDAAERCLEFERVQARKAPLGSGDVEFARLAARDLARCERELAGPR
jgi:tetratricopeptide (TPR) repeat protein/predicted Ser/Thr protein kinase